jgi:N-acetylglucosaminyldiphosphoundecaprenol N-acetyl-beta-D-mannosaminyltransferase
MRAGRDADDERPAGAAAVSEWFAGIRVSPMRREALLEYVTATLRSRQRRCVTFLNPDYALRALSSRRLREDINGCDLVLVDGNGIRLLTPLFGFTVPERLDADTVAPLVFRDLARRGGRVFLFGGAPGVAAAAAGRLVSRFPGLDVVGTEHGYHDVERGHPGVYAAEDSAAIVARVNAGAPDLLVVSLPTPLQQRWTAQHRARLRVPVVMTVGSYLDHVAEARSPLASWYPWWADRLRLNWLYRLAREPRRLWRRYSLDYAELVARVLWLRVARTRRPARRDDGGQPVETGCPPSCRCGQ